MRIWRGIAALNRKFPDNYNGIFIKIRTSIPIIGLFLLIVMAAALLNIQQQSSLAFAATDNKNVYGVGGGDISDIFELVSGIIAAILSFLSLKAYRKLKIKGMVFVSAAFGIFAVRTIAIEISDLYVGGVQSSVPQSIFEMMIFIALVLFFVAIVQSEKILPKAPQL